LKSIGDSHSSRVIVLEMLMGKLVDKIVVGGGTCMDQKRQFLLGPFNALLWHPRYWVCSYMSSLDLKPAATDEMEEDESMRFWAWYGWWRRQGP